MNYEIEAKIKVPGPGPIAVKLKELDAEFLHEVRQADTYFMDPHKLLHKKDCGLRIRKQIQADRQTAVITFKGSRSQSRYKSRPEYETEISNAETMKRILESLGYAERITFEKKRAVWRIDECLVCLDELPRLGCFVEVEGPNENAIFDVLEKLNLQNEPHIPHSYASMMKHDMEQKETRQTDVFLSSEELP